MEHRKLWIGLFAVMAASFAVLGYYGREIYRQAPPIPERVITTSGKVLFTGQNIKDGQNVWQSTGGQQVGTVWGHGSYVAPDWSADFLHRESEWLLAHWAKVDHGVENYADLGAEDQAALKARLKGEIRSNTYNADTGDLVVSELRAEAIAAVSEHYKKLYGGDASLDELREAYAIPKGVLPDAARRDDLTAFYFWAAWACGTNRPGTEITYTNNWPPEPLIDNRPTAAILVWSVLSFIVLLAGIGALSWYYVVEKARAEEDPPVPERDPSLAFDPTPSMKATLKYFWVVMALIVTQVGMGAVTAHYAVEGSGFYGIPLAEVLPYAVTRTWHTQLAIFWIATAFLATGLFLAPAVVGREPKFQRLGVNALFGALLVIVVGTLFGTWYGTRQKMGLEMNFWFGHQGYEYVDLGRFWQIFLFIGLFIWLFLMGRGLWPAMRKPGPNRHLLALFSISCVAIALFYGAGLMWGRQTNLAIAEYWRWWLVHLWVEGFFEVFTTVVIAFLFARLQLVKVRTATAAVLFATSIFLSGGIIGTFHHLYFTGTPTAVLALGAVFSALEVVPLVLIGFEAYGNLSVSRVQGWVAGYRWPVYCFVAVAFWNLVGAGLFGFLINPPIALYYMQGLNTTAVHGHTALFGVYGMLAIGLMLFCLKGMAVRNIWKTSVLKFAFWSINIGLALMVLLSDLPRGVLQAWASVNDGMWMARSAEFTQTNLMDTLRWLRVIGDTIFAVGVLSLGWFVLGLKAGWSVAGPLDRDVERDTPKGENEIEEH
ncbi:MAG: nitric-oxide reductase large subunit [Candidatus Hydrogenedentes bacterium]|nr:nitric-oxide reductase large subunit [Candidatus Hydrogenedentota bacterium]